MSGMGGLLGGSGAGAWQRPAAPAKRAAILTDKVYRGADGFATQWAIYTLL